MFSKSPGQRLILGLAIVLFLGVTTLGAKAGPMVGFGTGLGMILAALAIAVAIMAGTPRKRRLESM